VLTAHPNEPRAATSVELEITGPRLIRRGDTPHFRAFSDKSSYQFYPPKIWHSPDASTTYLVGISGSKMSPEWQERVFKTPPVVAASNTWSMYLIQ
jgi:hypothetical protein